MDEAISLEKRQLIAIWEREYYSCLERFIGNDTANAADTADGLIDRIKSKFK